jgi:hypothetical protein
VPVESVSNDTSRVEHPARDSSRNERSTSPSYASSSAVLRYDATARNRDVGGVGCRNAESGTRGKKPRCNAVEPVFGQPTWITVATAAHRRRRVGEHSPNRGQACPVDRHRQPLA